MSTFYYILPKESQSPLGLYRNPPTFFFTNPRFVLLIHDRRFVLQSFFRASTFVMNHQRMYIAYILRHLLERLACMTVSRSEKKSIYNILNMDMFLTETHRFATGSGEADGHALRGGPAIRRWGALKDMIMSISTIARDIVKSIKYCH